MDATMLFAQASQSARGTPAVLGVSTKAPPGKGAAGLFAQLLAGLTPQVQALPSLAIADIPTLTITPNVPKKVTTEIDLPLTSEKATTVKEPKLTVKVVVSTETSTEAMQVPAGEGSPPTVVVPLVAMTTPPTALTTAETTIAGPEQGSDQQEKDKKTATTTEATLVPAHTAEAQALVVDTQHQVLTVVGLTEGATLKSTQPSLTLETMPRATEPVSQKPLTSLPSQQAQEPTALPTGDPLTASPVAPPPTAPTMTVREVLAAIAQPIVSDAKAAGPVTEPVVTTIPLAQTNVGVDAAASLMDAELVETPLVAFRPVPKEMSKTPTAPTLRDSDAPVRDAMPLKVQHTTDDVAEMKSTKPVLDHKETAKPVPEKTEQPAPSFGKNEQDVSVDGVETRKLQMTADPAPVASAMKAAAPAKEKSVDKSSTGVEATKGAGENQNGNAPAGQSVTAAEKAYTDGSLGKNSSNAHQQPSLPKTDSVAPKEHTAFTSNGSTLPPDIAQSVVEQVAQKFAMDVQGETSEIRISLKPESLGDVAVKIRMEDGKMEARIDVSQVAVKAAIESQLPQLRQSLQSKGIDVQRIDVFATGESASRDSRQQHNHPSRQKNGKQSADVDPLEPYQSTKMFGYNTMEVII